MEKHGNEMGIFCDHLEQFLLLHVVGEGLMLEKDVYAFMVVFRKYVQTIEIVDSIPNCEICKWCYIKGHALFFNIVCAAQGYQCNEAVYNSALCKKLFEKKEEDNAI